MLNSKRASNKLLVLYYQCHSTILPVWQYYTTSVTVLYYQCYSTIWTVSQYSTTSVTVLYY